MPNTTSLSVEWSDFERYYERVINEAEEALQLIEELQRTKVDPPAMVEFFEPRSGKALAVGVGRMDTVVTFQESLDPPYYISLGSFRDDGITSFCYGNEDTEYLNQNRVPLQSGLDALLFFVLHRGRPPGLEWECL